MNTNTIKIKTFFNDYTDEKKSWVASFAQDMLTNPQNHVDIRDKAVNFAEYLNEWCDEDDFNEETVSERANEVYYVTYYHQLEGNGLDYLDYLMENYDYMLDMEQGAYSAAQSAANLFWYDFMSVIFNEIVNLDYSLEYYKNERGEMPLQDENDTIDLDEDMTSDDINEIIQDVINGTFEIYSQDENDSIEFLSEVNFTEYDCSGVFATLSIWTEVINGLKTVYVLTSRVKVDF